MSYSQDQLRHLTNPAMLRGPVAVLIDRLVELLPGDPLDYTVDGRLNIVAVDEGARPHSGSSRAVADLILELWHGNGALSATMARADRHQARVLAQALRASADALDDDARVRPARTA